MLTRSSIVAIAVAMLLSSTPLSAKTLVYCSEGSPENFYPGVNTTGTSFDANSRSTAASSSSSAAAPRSCRAWPRSWDISDDGKVYTFQLRKGVKWQTTDDFTPTRDLNADDVVFSLRAPVEGGQSLLQGDEREPLLLQRHGHAQAAEVGREGRRLHGQVHAEPARSAVPVRPRDGLRRRSSRRNTPTRC